MTSDGIALGVGDHLRIERRYLVDGVMTCVTDEGRFAGVERVGTLEHIIIKDAKTKGTRLFPLHAVSQIEVIKHARRPGRAKAPTVAGWDPGVV